MEFLTVSLLNGVIYGLLLFMVSAGLTLIFGMMGVLNFAHASFYMVGAYLAYTLQKFVGFTSAVLLSTVLVGLLGVIVERFFLRRVHKHGHAHELLLTRTRVGIVVRAAIHRPQMAEALGHNVPLVFMAVFGIGAALAGLAGALAGAFYTTNPNMALELGVIVFVVVVVGGLGSMAGAMIASLLIGLISSFAVGVDLSLASLFGLLGAGDWAQQMGGLMTLKVSSVAATIPFALMLLILLIRPSGLMGEKG